MATKTIGAKAAAKKARKGSTDIPLEYIPDRAGRKQYPNDVKEEAVRRVKAGESAVAVAKAMNISNDQVISKWKRLVDAGLPLQPRGGNRLPGTGRTLGEPNIALGLRAALEKASKQRDERLEAAATIVEIDGPGGKESLDLAKKIRAMKKSVTASAS